MDSGPSRLQPPKHQKADTPSRFVSLLRNLAVNTPFVLVRGRRSDKDPTDSYRLILGCDLCHAIMQNYQRPTSLASQIHCTVLK